MTAFLTVFFTVFLAELGDKTQLATVLFAADSDKPKALVFTAAAIALTASSAIAVLLGAAADRWLTMLPLKLLAGLGFVVIGVLLVIEHIKTV
ncbi:MAG: TMEM165/GDT1 family protein [Pseudomonadota bacterium]